MAVIAILPGARPGHLRSLHIHISDSKELVFHTFPARFTD
jgi:hypothetical protein